MAVASLMVAGCTSASVPTTASSTTIEPPSPTTTASPTTPTSITTSASPSELLDEYLVEGDAGALADLVRIVEQSASIDELSSFLHDTIERPPHTRGRTTVAAPIGFNQNRTVVVRTPVGYDPARPWPLIVVYHTWGGTADRILDRLEDLLGPRIEEFVVAAPDDYRQTIIDAPRPVTSEHVSVWRAIREGWHIDADRVFLAGYSLGGETVVTLATMHPGHVAGGLAMAAGFAIPSDVEGLWEAVLPNLADVAMLHVWGTEDATNVPGLNGRRQDMTLAEQNERLTPLLETFGLGTYRHRGIEDVGHEGAYPTDDEIDRLLASTRHAFPESFTHTFRYIHQADTWWVEGHEWEGEAWLTEWPGGAAAPPPSEDELRRAIFEALGRIEASIEGQAITVDTTHLADLTVWLETGMVDLDLPVTVVHNGTTVFDGIIEPSIAVALQQARRTLDFDRVRIAGIRIDAANATATLVGPDDEFPDIVRGISL